MTDNDHRLIAKAHATPFIFWSDILDLIPHADTDEARTALDRIASHKCHLEEASEGIL